MAQNRSGGKRRLATLITIIVLVSSCGQETDSRYGWFAPEAVETISVAPDAESIVLRVELPSGYVGADDFVQRATLVLGPQTRTVTEFDLDDSLEIPISPKTWHNGEVGLELTLGFCAYDVKEVCYIDTPRISVNLQTDPDERLSSGITIMYRPEPPK